MIEETYDLTIDIHAKAGLEPPINTGGDDLVDRKLNCAVIRALYEKRKEDGLKEFDPVRAAFVEGRELYPHAGFAAKNHLQTAVRNSRCTKGYFRPFDDKGKPIKFKG